jgi:hypothetical protein
MFPESAIAQRVFPAIATAAAMRNPICALVEIPAESGVDTISLPDGVILETGVFPLAHEGNWVCLVMAPPAQLDAFKSLLKQYHNDNITQVHSLDELVQPGNWLVLNRLFICKHPTDDCFILQYASTYAPFCVYAPADADADSDPAALAAVAAPAPSPAAQAREAAQAAHAAAMADVARLTNDQTVAHAACADAQRRLMQAMQRPVEELAALQQLAAALQHQRNEAYSANAELRAQVTQLDGQLAASQRSALTAPSAAPSAAPAATPAAPAAIGTAVAGNAELLAHCESISPESVAIVHAYLNRDDVNIASRREYATRALVHAVHLQANTHAPEADGLVTRRSALQNMLFQAEKTSTLSQNMTISLPSLSPHMRQLQQDIRSLDHEIGLADINYHHRAGEVTVGYRTWLTRNPIPKPPAPPQ